MLKKLIDALFDFWDYGICGFMNSKKQNYEADDAVSKTHSPIIKTHKINTMIDIIGVIITALTFIHENFAAIGFLAVLFAIGSLEIGLGWLMILLAIIIIAVRNIPKAGTFISRIFIWFLIYAVVSFLLFWFEYYTFSLAWK